MKEVAKLKLAVLQDVLPKPNQVRIQHVSVLLQEIAVNRSLVHNFPKRTPLWCSFLCHHTIEAYIRSNIYANIRNKIDAECQDVSSSGAAYRLVSAIIP